MANWGGVANCGGAGRTHSAPDPRLTRKRCLAARSFLVAPRELPTMGTSISASVPRDAGAVCRASSAAARRQRRVTLASDRAARECCGKDLVVGDVAPRRPRARPGCRRGLGATCYMLQLASWNDDEIEEGADGEIIIRATTSPMTSRWFWNGAVADEREPDDDAKSESEESEGAEEIKPRKRRRASSGGASQPAASEAAPPRMDWLDEMCPPKPEEPNAMMFIVHNARRHSFMAKLDGVGMPDEVRKGYRMRNKTRTSAFRHAGGTDSATNSEHESLRVCVLWLWQKHCLHLQHNGLPEVQMPDYVHRFLLPREGGKLLPCSACEEQSGKCTAMAEAKRAESVCRYGGRRRRRSFPAIGRRFAARSFPAIWRCLAASRFQGGSFPAI